MTIREEADHLLSSGLRDILEAHGTVLPTGSYYLNLMTWRDLDLYLLNDRITAASFFRLGEQMMSLLNPVKMSYRNEHLGGSETLPHGLYWGVYLGNERDGAWKVDLWCVSSEEGEQRHKYCRDLSSKLDGEKRDVILYLKEQCWRNPNYRQGFSSVDIYEAVVGEGITSFDAFKDWINSRANSQLID